MKSLARRVHALLSSFLPRSCRPYRFSGGLVYLDITESPMMLARAMGLYEIEKHRALAFFLRTGGTFIDVGANKGDFSLAAAKLSGAGGKILAFEPEPRNRDWFARSVELNGYANIRIFGLALGDRSGTAPFFLSEMSGLHTLVPGLESRGHVVIDVKIRTLDDFLEEIMFKDAIDVIKIDVEGAGMRFLRGAERTLAKNSDITILLDIHPRLGVDPREVCDYLVARGFSIFREKYPFSSPVDNYADLTAIIARRLPG